jgi:hypothetical protein
MRVNYGFQQRRFPGGYLPSVSGYMDPGTHVPMTDAPNGTPVSVIGHGFGPNTGTIMVGAQPATVTLWTDTEIQITVPTQGVYPNVSTVTVTTSAGATALGPPFTTTAPVGPCGTPYLAGQAALFNGAAIFAWPPARPPP